MKHHGLSLADADAALQNDREVGRSHRSLGRVGGVAMGGFPMGFAANNIKQLETKYVQRISKKRIDQLQPVNLYGSSNHHGFFFLV